VLSRPSPDAALREKRRKYDELGANWDHPERQAPPRGGGYPGAPQDASEFHFGGSGFSDFFEQFFGSGRRPSGDFGTGGNGTGPASFSQRGQDVEGDILVTLGEVLHGATRTIQLQRTDPHAPYSLDVAARVAAVPRRSILVYCRVGLVRPVFQEAYGIMTFNEEAIYSVRRIETLRTVHGVDLAWIKSTFELLDELERLRAEVRFFRRH
jgi:hypothetical protein